MNRFRLAMDHGGLMAPRWSWTSRPIARSLEGNFALLNVHVGSTASVERSRHVGFTPDSGHMAATQLNDASGHQRKSATTQLFSVCRELRGTNSGFINGLDR
jgi:hypothetical protein